MDGDDRTDRDDGARRDAFEYQRDRCQSVLAVLRRRGYARAYEIGCGDGELTAELARLSEHVLATDTAASALARTGLRCAHLPNVETRPWDPAAHRLAGSFDLIVLSEVGYYFSPQALTSLATGLSGSLAPGGELVAIHWLGGRTDRGLHGDAVHSLLLANLSLQWVTQDRLGGFRVDSWINAGRGWKGFDVKKGIGEVSRQARFF
jgi:SAM-dependent methyltransferase